MSKLFESIQIKSVNFKNRLVVSPMCQYSSLDGFSSDWHLVNLGSRAVGGAALVFSEAASVSPEGRITPFDLGIWKDEHIEGLKRITDFISSQGAVAGIQLAHAGRKASHSEPWNVSQLISPNEENGWERVAPSALSFHENTLLPKALDKAGIIKVIEDFRIAAQRSLTAGFKVIEIHAAHGYLLHQFLSPLANQRTDEYGGSFENRIRLLIEVTLAIQTVWPSNLPLFVRISASDWANGGWNIEESVLLSKILKEKGVDLIDCSSGGLVVHQSIEVKPLYQVPFAQKIKIEADILTGAVGLITTAQEAESILQQGKADMIFMAREFIRDPYFALRAAHQLEANVKWPIQYERGKFR
ncbi:NADH:flavin oxidoreductase/NADH oxidase [Pedobacter cryophilus]|uniref:NADH:flavin oxidoreductase/NADH oxidase n=1 Tax=Pedobacter cryophilus TaxID=2571271 RepID=A0A4U1BZX1_9SPHI|nr:NADH:flavin oxidoreductase/NADH oxidase [Pedobacter cryophilus]TKB98772.1 NADH:flavin oxidoreductase/NADH oxidase [Pedobacter cryophilus]